METALRNDWSQGLQTFIRIYSLLKSECLSANIKLTFHKALIRSVITYACPIWELASDTYLLKLQRLQNKVLHTIGNFPRCISVRNLHTTFNPPYVYDYITKLCSKQAEGIWNHENEHVRGIGQVKPDTKNIRGLNFAVVKLTTVQVTTLQLLHEICKISMICSAEPVLTEYLCVVQQQ
jgi:hypothetical protein